MNELLVSTFSEQVLVCLWFQILFTCCFNFSDFKFDIYNSQKQTTGKYKFCNTRVLPIFSIILVLMNLMILFMSYVYIQ